jgi:putative ATP-dependent endonuclease of the OLD family
MRDANKITTEEGEKSRLEIVNDLLGKLSQALKTDRIDKFTKSMESFLREQIQLPEEALNIEIGLPRGDALLKKLDLNARDHKEVPMLPIEQLGRGFSALAMVGLFQAINQIDDEKQGAIFLLEEPECYLGPHLRIVFANTLRSLAKRGNQVFVSTHSPEFFDPMMFESAIVVEKKNGVSTQCHQIKSKSPYAIDKTVKFIEPNLALLLFSKNVLLVEGPDDLSVFHNAFDIIGFQPEYKGLSILNTGGKGNIPFLYSVCKNLQMPVFVVADEDYESNLKKLDNTGSSYFVLRPDLEGALKTSKAKNNNTQHVVETINICSNENDLKSNFPQIHEAIMKVKGFLEL